MLWVECDKSYSPGRVYQISQHGSVVECVSFQAYIGTQSLAISCEAVESTWYFL